MADELHQRYQRAADAYRAHEAGCPVCCDDRHCPVGAPLHGTFARLQDAWLTRLRGQRR
ncbi:hypothetical protein [Streptomyces solincola]|uniref:hypothetical protein n=1 Tax=Streptomyces solincola TaxID=2100817 RepID=UPI0015E31F66|nr:hypothetical protein [Streptomyces solincola]